jgi:hypothetical protein
MIPIKIPLIWMLVVCPLRLGRGQNELRDRLEKNRGGEGGQIALEFSLESTQNEKHIQATNIYKQRDPRESSVDKTHPPAVKSTRLNRSVTAL